MLVSRKHRKLLLNLKQPAKVTTVLPSAKMVEVKGSNLVVVPHREDEVRVLRNLGFDAPAPMSYYYDWPGLYKPFEHQRITAEFLTLNPRAFCLNGLGCIAGDEKVRVSRKAKSYETDLRALYKKFHTMPDRDSWKARSLMGDRFGMNKLLDVLYKGEQATLRITLEDGKSFRCTPDHRIARPDGSWTEAGALRVGDYLVTNGQVTYTCPECGQPRARATPPRYPEQVCRACKGRAHSSKMAGENNPAWKGGRFIDPDGYVRVLAPGHHRVASGGYVYEHILVAEAAYGGPITKEYHVHHINGVKHDNRPENLEVLLASDHHRQHDHRVKLDGSVSAKGGVVVVLPKQSEIVTIEDGGVVDVYDLCMEAPHHNFVVNGVVVHNSGKSISTLWAFDYLRKQGRIRKMLIISPLSTLERAWGDEIFRHFPEYNFAVLHGSRDKRHKLIDQDYDIFIINHDGIKSKETLDKLMAKEGIDLVVVDEIAAFRNSSTERWKYLNRLVNGDAKLGIKPKDWVWGLTGTPTPNEPTDAWAQCRLVNPGKVPKFFSHFRDSVMRKSSPFKWEVRKNALNIVSEVMQPSVRFSREDCIDLPPTTFVTRQADLTPEQKKAYKDMLNKLTAEVGSGQITAVNEAVKLNKLLQILCLRYDTNVLTQRGWVEIRHVHATDLVWDGVDWVSHGGAVRKGAAEVVECGGVYMTPDHLVLSKYGWVTAKEFLDGNDGKGLDWPEVWIPDGTAPGGVDNWEDQNGDLAVPLRLRARGCSGEPIPSERTEETPEKLWMPPREHEARYVVLPAAQVVVGGEGEVPQPKQQRLGKLRGAWGRYVRAVESFLRGVCRGYGGQLLAGFDAWADRQQWAVLSGELPMGDSKTAGEQHSRKHPNTNSTRGDDTSTSCGTLRPKGSHVVGAHKAVRVARGESAEHTVVEVYDILNCGPRNRFVVRGSSGELRIVHNCGAAYTEDGTVEIPAGPRIELVREIIEEAEGKVIVFVPLRGALDMVAKELSKHYSVAVVHGGVSKTDRDRIFGDFQKARDPRVLVSVASAMSHGLTLTASNTIIWYAPTTSNEVTEQANARITRPGQTRNTLIVNIEGSDIERKMYERLKNKSSMQGLLLDMLKGDQK